MIKRHCIVCLKKLKRESSHGRDNIDNCPSDAIYLSSVGNYGSSVYDMGEFYKDRIETYICDECLKERAEYINFVRHDDKVITFDKVLEDTNKMGRGF